MASPKKTLEEADQENYMLVSDYLYLLTCFSILMICVKISRFVNSFRIENPVYDCIY